MNKRLYLCNVSLYDYKSGENLLFNVFHKLLARGPTKHRPGTDGANNLQQFHSLPTGTVRPNNLHDFMRAIFVKRLVKLAESSMNL
jgi:hypothetical protein